MNKTPMDSIRERMEERGRSKARAGVRTPEGTEGSWRRERAAESTMPEVAT